MTISYQMFSLEKKYLTEFLAFGVMSFFLLSSSFMVISTTCIPSASAFMNQNLLGLYSPNNPVPIVPANPLMNSFYGGGYGPGYGGGGGGIGQSFGTGLVGLLPQVLGLGTGYGGYGYGGGGGGIGQSFGTGLVGLLPQVLGGIGSLFGQDSGSSYSMGDGYGGDYDSGYGFSPPPRDSHGLSGILGGIGSLFGQDSGSSYSMGDGYGSGYDSGYSSGYQSHDDQGFSDFQASNDPFASGSDSSAADQANYLDDYSSDSSSGSPFGDLRSMDSSSGNQFSSSPDRGSSDSLFGGLFD